MRSSREQSRTQGLSRVSWRRREGSHFPGWRFPGWFFKVLSLGFLSCRPELGCQGLKRLAHAIMAVTVFSGWSLEVGGPQERDLDSLRVSPWISCKWVLMMILHTPSLVLQRPGSRPCSSCKAQAEVYSPGSILAQDNFSHQPKGTVM